MERERIVAEATTLDGVRLLTPSFVYEDFRGHNLETYNEELLFQATGNRIPFVQDSLTVSDRHVLRGIHGDTRTWKLLSCPFGKVYVVVVNYDRECDPAPQFRKWEAFILSARNRRQLLVPPGFGNAHLVLSEQAIFSYKLSAYTDTARQFSLRWDDPDLGIEWPITNPILSKRDRGTP